MKNIKLQAKRAHSCNMRVHFLRLSLIATFVLSSLSLFSQWFTGYTYRKEINIDPTQVVGSANHINFPMLFSASDNNLRSTGNGGLVENISGYDIVFTTADGTTQINHEIEYFDPATGKYIAWVQIPSLDYQNNTIIYMYFGNSGVSANPSTAATWDDKYEAVYHLNGAANSTSASGRDGTNNGATQVYETSTPAGFIGGSYDFEESENDDISINSFDILDGGSQVDELTITAWINPESFAIGDARIFSKADGTNPNDHDWMLSTNSTQRLRLRVSTGGSTKTIQTADNELSAGTWQYVAGIYNSSDLQLFINGQLVTSLNIGGGNVDNNNKPINIGDNDDDGKYWDGLLDEIRISCIARTQEWLETEYNNQLNPEDFFMIGDIECSGVDPGVASAASNTIEPGESTNITLSSYSGNIQWQISTDGLVFSDISGETSATLNTGNLTQTTYYRAKVSNAVCTEYSNIEKITVRPPFVYKYTKEITINTGQVCGGPHNNFQMLINHVDVDLKHVSYGGHISHIHGYDLVFSSNNSESTILHHDLESYDPSTGSITAWVRLPNIDDDTTIFMHYGNGNVISNPSTDSTWDSEYLGVWHFNENAYDATSNGNDGINFGAEAINSKISGGMDFEYDDDDRIEVGTFDIESSEGNAVNTATISAWVYSEEFQANGDGRIISKTTGHDNKDHYYMLSNYNNGTNNYARMRLKTDGAPTTDDGTITYYPSTSTWTAGTWYYFVMTYDGSLASNNITLYLNGSIIGQTNKAGDILRNSNTRVGIGNQPGIATDPRKRWDGIIDEVRVLNVARSSDWLCTEYNNQSDPESFYSIGTEIACSATGGSAESSDYVLFSGEQTTLELTGFDGDIQWQSSTDNISFSDISGATLSTYNTGALSSTTYFRALVTKNSTCSDISNTITITVKPRFLDGYTYRKKITIDHNFVSDIHGSGTNLFDFPLLFDYTDPDLKDKANGGKVHFADGEDIAFTMSDGQTMLTYYREFYDKTTGQIISWVKIPELSSSSNTELYIYFNRCDVFTNNYENTNTWSNDYEAVYFLNDDYNNKTSTASLDGTNYNSVDATGKISGADDFEKTSSTQRIEIGSYNINDEFTLSAWIKPETLPTTNGDEMRIVSKASGTNDSDHSFGLGTIYNTSTGEPQQYHRLTLLVNAGGSTEKLEAYPTSLADNNWTYVSATFNGNEINIYDNGNFLNRTSKSGGLSTNLSNIAIGNIDNGDANMAFDGIIDHVCISKTARSEDWIKTEYNNHNNPSSFYNVTSETESSFIWDGDISTDWGSSSNWNGCDVPPTRSSITVPEGCSYYPVLDQNREIQDIEIEQNATVTISGNYSLQVYGDIKNDGTFTATDGTMEFSGDTYQYLKGTGTFTGNNITINNSGEGVYFQQEAEINGTLDFSQGNLFLTGNDLIVNGTGQITNADATSYIITTGSGSLCQKSIGPAGRTGDVVYPIGTDNNSYFPVIIKNTGTTDNFCINACEFLNEEATCSGGNVINNQNIGVTWYINEEVSGGSNVELTLQWKTSDEVGGFNIANTPFISHHNGHFWEKYEVPFTTGTLNTLPYLKGTGITEFSPVSAGSGDSPLPVTLVDFFAKAENNLISLYWKTASETNNDYFDIERSKDGVRFSKIGQVNGSGNINYMKNYSFIDESPAEDINYYRLKQVDYDGSSSYSSVVSAVCFEIKGFTFDLIPNPVMNDNIILQTNTTEEVNIQKIQIINSTGSEEMVFRNVVLSNGQFKFNAEILEKGIYMMLISIEDSIYVKKFIVLQ